MTKKRPYHHGDLRSALMRAALLLVEEHGVKGLALSDAARLAGVSVAAPYRHFRDRDQLLADIAQLGFGHFEAALAQAWNQGAPDPMTAFCNIGKAYLEFARTQPGYYAAMFGDDMRFQRALKELDPADWETFSVRFGEWDKARQ